MAVEQQDAALHRVHDNAESVEPVERIAGGSQGWILLHDLLQRRSGGAVVARELIQPADLQQGGGAVRSSGHRVGERLLIGRGKRRLFSFSWEVLAA